MLDPVSSDKFIIKSKAIKNIFSIETKLKITLVLQTMGFIYLFKIKRSILSSGGIYLWVFVILITFFFFYRQ